MFKKTLKLTSIVLSLATINACASPQYDPTVAYRIGGASFVSQRAVGQAGHVKIGTIIAARDVVIQSQNGSIGSLAGAAIGGLAGSKVGGGSGRIAGSILGAVAGGMAGSAIERNIRQSNGVELIIQLDDGRQMSLIQEKDFPYRTGVKVTVSQYGREFRASPLM
ncbi:hypothetical protein CL689_06700 [Candidatus Saccharibacteria bacterium]|nr:hypothetical protein [Candidatus Saccharibacteria bacterium]